jgi:hypothetical protein
MNAKTSSESQRTCSKSIPCWNVGPVCLLFLYLVYAVTTKFLGNLKGRDHFEDLDVDGS